MEVALAEWGLNLASLPSKFVIGTLSTAFAMAGGPFSEDAVALVSKVQRTWLPALNILLASGATTEALRLIALFEAWSFGNDLSHKRTTLHLVGYGQRLWALLDEVGTAAPSLYQFDIPVHVQREMIEASVEADSLVIKTARRNLAKVLRDVFSTPEICRLDLMRINPIGIVSWWPWATVTLAGKSVVREITGLAWARPASMFKLPEAEVNGDVFMPDLLVIDLSFKESKQILGLWMSAGLPAEKVFSYDSRSESPQRNANLLDLLSRSSNPWFFVHATSSVTTATDSGLQVGPSQIVTLEDVYNSSPNSLRSAVVIACESGRPNAFVHGQSIVNAIGLKSEAKVVGTLWAIRAKLGAQFMSDALPLVMQGIGLDVVWRRLMEKNHADYAPFLFSQP